LHYLKQDALAFQSSNSPENFSMSIFIPDGLSNVAAAESGTGGGSDSSSCCVCNTSLKHSSLAMAA